MKRVLLAVLMALCFGCVKPEPLVGSVVEKTFVPAHTEIGMMMQPDVGGGFAYTYYPDVYPDQYFLDVRREDGRVFRKSVTKDHYDQTKVGDTYDERPK